MAEPFPAQPIRAACPSCGNSVLFPRLHGLAPGSTVSCDCPRCGRKVSVVNSGAPHPSKARRAAVLLVALVVIAPVVLVLVLGWDEFPVPRPYRRGSSLTRVRASSVGRSPWLQRWQPLVTYQSAPLQG